ncbi:hypothetical protein ACCE111639_11990 [Acinetobacter celticus]|nr:hypothetical protein [Acinetobacter celticus]
MTTAKVFMTGRSQAIRVLKEFRFERKEVEIFRRGDEVILREKPVTADQLFKVLAQMPVDFICRRKSKRTTARTRRVLKQIKKNFYASKGYKWKTGSAKLCKATKISRRNYASPKRHHHLSK